MKIDVRLIKNHSQQLSKIISDYETNYLNFFNEVNKSLNSWQDLNSKYFEEQLILEKNENQRVLMSLKELENLDKIIYIYYREIAQEINYVKENKEELFKIFDSYIEIIKQIIEQINNLDLDFCPREKRLILNVKNILLSNQKMIISIKNKCNNVINNIENNEMKIRNIIAKLEYVKIKDSDYKDIVW